jgi:ABC-type polysaccharide transport system, permease component
MVGSSLSAGLKGRWRVYFNYRQIYLLALPGLIYYVVFKLGPVWGYALAFEDFNPYKGLFGSAFVGLRNFAEFFQSKYFLLMLRNTVAISLLNLFFYFPAPILLALLLNEIRFEGLKRLNQTLLYLPHFMSWVVITGLTFFLLSTDVGLVNKAIAGVGGRPVSFLSNPHLFWWIILLQDIWKEVGWGTIIFLAAISQIDPSLYEAAVMDGATRIQQTMRITLPSIMPTIVILFILRLGKILDVSFEQIILMYNPFVKSVAEIFDTYAYNQGVVQGNYSLGVAVGLCKSALGLVLVVASNKITKALGQEGIY